MAFPPVEKWVSISLNTTLNAATDLWVMAGATTKSHGARGYVIGTVADLEIGVAHVHYYRDSDSHTRKATFIMPVPRGHDYKIEARTTHGKVEFAALVMAADDSFAGEDLFKEVYKKPVPIKSDQN